MEDMIIALIPKFTAVLSMGGSAYIMFDVIRTGQVRQATHPRLLLGMTSCDFWVSFSFFFSTWAEPADADADHTTTVWAVGNQLTCNIQGFLHQLALAVVLYNAALSVYYMAKIRYRYKDKTITRRLEPFLHGIPWLFGVATALVAWILDLYNGSGWGCWINSYPLDCHQQQASLTSATTTSTGGNPEQEEVPCERGANASIFRWAIFFVPLWVAILIAFANMFLVYRSVFLQEQRMNRFNFHYQQEKKRLQALREQYEKREENQDAAEDDNDDASIGSASSMRSVFSVGSAAFLATSATNVLASGTSAVKSTLQDASSQFKKMRQKKKEEASLKIHFKHSRRVARQGYWFCGAFIATWIFPTIGQSVQLIWADKDLFVLNVLTAFFVPLHGFFIFIVYIQPRVSKWLHKNQPWWYNKVCSSTSSRRTDDSSKAQVTTTTSSALLMSSSSPSTRTQLTSSITSSQQQHGSSALACLSVSSSQFNHDFSNLHTTTLRDSTSNQQQDMDEASPQCHDHRRRNAIHL